MNDENQTNENTVEETKVETTATKSKTNSTIDLPSFHAQKVGMTRIFDKEGNHIPVTVLKLIDNSITQVKTIEKDGYSAYQVGFYDKKKKLITKPILGHLAKAKVSQNYKSYSEQRVESADESKLGSSLSYGAFPKETYIDVTSVSKGKGFQGVIKKFGFSGGPATHGSKFHRTTGSIGNRATPGRVFKNKKMPGQLGNKRVTTQNLKIVEINEEKGYLLIKGSVPGGKNTFVRVSKAIKK